MGKKQLKKRNKRLQRKLWEEKRTRRYAERDAKMWCEVVLEQEEDLQRKDILIADLENDIGDEGSRWKSYCAGHKDGKEGARPKVRAWLNDEAIDTNCKPVYQRTNEELTAAFTSTSRQTFISGVAEEVLTIRDKVVYSPTIDGYRMWSEKLDGHYFDGIAAQDAKPGEKFQILIAGSVDLLENKS